MFNNIFKFNDKDIRNSHADFVNNALQLQRGYYYILYNFAGFNNFLKYDECVLSNEKNFYSVIQLIDIIPIIHLENLKTCVNWDLITRGHQHFGNEKNITEVINNQFRNFGENVLTYKIKYKNVNTNKIYESEISEDRCYILNTKKELTKNEYSITKYSATFLLYSDAFNYDVNIKTVSYRDSTQPSCHKFPEDAETKSLRNKCISEIKQEVIKLYSYNIVKNLLFNNITIKKEEEIVIDGITWYNGFANPMGGSIRGFMFTKYIPYGWRLPKKEELENLLKKHPLLHKELLAPGTKPRERDYTGAIRNNAGMQLYYSTYYYNNGRRDIHVAVYEDYADYKNYFATSINVWNIASNSLVVEPFPQSTFNNDLNAFHIMLVKMSEEELKAQDEWCNSILANIYKYHTIDDIYNAVGITSLDEIKEIEFTLVDKKNKETVIKKSAENLFVNKLKAVIAEYIGNNNVLDASKIDISFCCKNGESGSLKYDDNVECNIKSYLTAIAPLLNQDICANNINSEKYLKSKDGSSSYHSTCPNIYEVSQYFQNLGILPTMYYYVKNTLEQLGINHNTVRSSQHECGSGYYSYTSTSYFPDTMYIKELKVTYHNGEQKTLKSIPLYIFALSSVYTNITVNRETYTENMCKFIDNVNDSFEKAA